MDFKAIKNKQKENKKHIEMAKDILIDISKKPRNSKFEKMPVSELYRAKQFRRDNKERKPKFKRYKKGTIVFVDFGIGIGNEFSHPHFAIVMDNKDNPSKGTLTVVPLTSKENSTNVNLEKNLINELLNKIKIDIDDINNLISSIIQLENNPLTLKDYAYYPSEEKKQEVFKKFAIRHKCKNMIVEASKFYEYVKKDREQFKNILDFYKKYDKNTYANTQAITTISKFKIMKPLNDLDPIGNTQISKSYINKLEKNIIKNILSIDIAKI